MQENMTALDDFISNVEILLNECDRREDVVESDTVEYMIGRIETCRRSLKGLKDNITLIYLEVGVTDPVSFNRHLSGLLEEIRKIESEWKIKKATSFHGGSPDYSHLHCQRIPSPGRPKCIINFDQLAFLREQGFNVTEISKMFDVSRQTLYTRCEEIGFDITKKYTDISDSELDELMKNIKMEHHLCGERILHGILRVDPINTALRWIHANPRCVYSVAGPNDLWHNDGLHKLKHWGIIVHGCIDGFSRTLVYLNCSSNNRADTVLTFFENAVKEYGLPARVRGDYGKENNGIEAYMKSQGVQINMPISGVPAFIISG